MVPFDCFDYQLIVHVLFKDDKKNDLKFSFNEQESAINTYRDFLNNPDVYYVELRTKVALSRASLNV